MDIKTIKNQAQSVVREIVSEASLKSGDILVLGGSSSETIGKSIGKKSSLDIGEAIVETFLNELSNKDIYLAVQGCEHINRSLVLERNYAEKKDLEIVSVVPALNAGGAFSVSAYKNMKDPVVVEHIVAKAGVDIGDTEIGMHVKFVQVPVRFTQEKIGEARVTGLKSRPKLIGGQRAQYK